MSHFEKCCQNKRGAGGGWEDNREGPPLTLHTPGSGSFVLERITLFG